MAGRSAILAIRIISDATQAARQMGTVESRAQKMERRMGTAAKAGGLFLAGIGAAAVKAGKDLQRIETINAQTEAAITSTGGAANVSASHVEKLAGRLEKLTATEAEATQENANLLLTFTNVRNEAGKGNAVFDRAVSTFVDMQRAVPTSSMNMLGKALNDPIKGVSALGRVGVQFTEQQKEQIKTLVESGDTMAAQKIILKELETQFGGSGAAYAKTSAGQAELAAHAYGELTETLTAQLLPAFNSLVSVALSVVGFLSQHQSATQNVVIAVTALAVAVIAINAALKVYRAALVVVAVAKGTLTVATAAQTAAQYALGTAWLAGRVAALGMAAGMRVLNAAMRANPLGLIITAITIVAGLFVLAYKRSETFRAIVNGVARFVVGYIRTVISIITSLVGWFRDKLPGAARAAGTMIGRAIRLYTTPLRTVIGLVMDLIGWIRNIRWPEPPGWMKSAAGGIGSLFGGGGAPRPPHGPGGWGGVSASSSTGRGGPSGGYLMLPTGGMFGGGNTTINVYGALDALGTAETILRLLRRRGVQLGNVRVVTA